MCVVGKQSLDRNLDLLNTAWFACTLVSEWRVAMEKLKHCDERFLSAEPISSDDASVADSDRASVVALTTGAGLFTRETTYRPGEPVSEGAGAAAGPASDPAPELASESALELARVRLGN